MSWFHDFESLYLDPWSISNSCTKMGKKKAMRGRRHRISVPCCTQKSILHCNTYNIRVDCITRISRRRSFVFVKYSFIYKFILILGYFHTHTEREREREREREKISYLYVILCNRSIGFDNPN